MDLYNLFIYFAVGGGFALVVTTILTFTGHMDFGGDVDMNIDSSGTDFHPSGGHDGHDGGLRVFSFASITAFFTFTGLTGIMFLEWELGNSLAIIFSVILGISSMFLIAYIYKVAKKLESDGTININSFLNSEAIVYIPFDELSPGEVTVNNGKTQMQYKAISLSGKLNTGDHVIVKQINGNVLSVQRIYS